MDLTNHQQAILNVLQEHRPRELYGLEILKLGNGKIKQWKMYSDYHLLEKGEYISSRLQTDEEQMRDNTGSENRRRLYRITPKGTLARPKENTAIEGDLCFA